MHTLIVSNPGHFHAALALRNRHHLLRDEVFVYSEDDPDLERFLALVDAFNRRQDQPTSWILRVYRGADHLERLIAERKGDVVLIAGKNDSKMSTIGRLQAEGFSVLGDKTWLIDGKDLHWVEKVATSRPLAIDMMTERHDIGHRIMRALCQDASVFGRFQTTGPEPGISMLSVHHLFKLVNGQPLTRPAWYFDTTIQGEGIMDVTTHLSDLALWMTDPGQACVYDRDIQLRTARQWPTAVPLELFGRITKLSDFPPGIRQHVTDASLSYLCNALIGFVLRGITVEMEERWDLVEPPGGGDAFRTVLRGTHARLALEHDASTGFESVLSVHPEVTAFRDRLQQWLAIHEGEFPGLRIQPRGGAYRIIVPPGLNTTHEQHFAKVLDTFLEYVANGEWPRQVVGDLLAKYTLLARAKAMCG